jgi:Sulfotransferase family
LAVHFIHISKAGGTALRHAVREARIEAGGRLVSPWGPVWAQRGHQFKLQDVRDGDKAVITLRDPVSRFRSGFYSRLYQGEPRHHQAWTPEERRAFSWFPTPGELAEALAAPGGTQRKRARFAMRTIAHLRRHMTDWTAGPAYLYANLDKVLYFARQESLDEDWEKLKELLGIPGGHMLPRDPKRAHRGEYPRDAPISDRGLEALREWYADDYELLEIAEHVRAGRVPPAPSTARRITGATRRAQVFTGRIARRTKARVRSRLPGGTEATPANHEPSA